MLHFIDDRNLVDVEREELNKILFEENYTKAQCEFPFEVVIPAVPHCTFGTSNGTAVANGNITTTAAAEPSTSANYYHPKSVGLPVFLPNVGVASASTSAPPNAVYLPHANVPTTFHRPTASFVTSSISPYYRSLTYASPQYIVPTVRNITPPTPLVYCPPPTVVNKPTSSQNSFDLPQQKVKVEEENVISFGQFNNEDDDVTKNDVTSENLQHATSEKTHKNTLLPSEVINNDEETVQQEHLEQQIFRNNDDEIQVELPVDDDSERPNLTSTTKNDEEIQQTADQLQQISPPTKSWASLFKNSAATTINQSNVIYKPSSSGELPENGVPDVSAPSLTTSSNSSSHVQQTSADRDPEARKLGTALKSCTLMHRGPSFQLRGLINSGNWCYVNATLQALMVCPPFVHLLRELNFLTIRSPSSTPVLDSLIKFVGEFSEKFTRKNAQDFDRGVPFEPTYVYNVLRTIRKDSSFRGRQEDAEEFLSLILNRLHEEMLNSIALIDKQQRDDISDVVLTTKNLDDDEDEWQQVGPNRKAAVTRTSKLSTTAISEIFSGVLRNTIQQLGSKETVNLESFFSLQLNIQANDVCSVTSALQHMNKEVFKTSSTKSKNEIDTIRRTTFQELPCVLVLHLKFFVYTDEGVKKLVKPISYGVDLQIDWNLLSPASNVTKMDKFGRLYKLFAVVFHHGEKAEGGHYTADVFHGGFWINVDDTKLSSVDESHVIGFQAGRVPYLLFYRRCDTFSEPRN